tara:strand:- start:279 stop:860 length:582 start_codon:yes stop_codon:yes gene_type:complete
MNNYFYLSVLFCSLILLSSCDKQSEVNVEVLVEERGFVETAEVYLLNNLNDSRGFCVDMTGYKTNADVNKVLQTHSCYSYQGSVSVDQGFDVSKISNGEFNLPFFNVCMEVENTESSSGLILRECNKNPKQQFVFEDDGKIKPVNDLSLCLTASDDYREGGGGSPVHLIRDLSLLACGDSFSTRQGWGLRSVN